MWYFACSLAKKKTNLLAADEYEKRLDNGCVGKGEGISSLSTVFRIFFGV